MTHPNPSDQLKPAVVVRDFVARIGGLPVCTLGALRAAGTLALSDELIGHRAELAAVAARLSDVLHDQVPAAPKGQRRRLLRLRRDLFNLRVPRDGDLEVVGDESLRAELRAFREKLDAVDQLQANLDEALAREQGAAADHLLRAFEGADVRAGLRLSSPTLFGAVAEHSDGGSLDQKLERGLARYLTRIAGKSTPFGRFCAITHGRVGPGLGALELHADPLTKWSRIRANKRLFEKVLAHLTADDAARHQFPLRLNPTVRWADSHVTFLAAFGAREAFQTVARNGAVDLLVEVLRAHGSVRLRQLAKTLVARPEIEATSDEAEAYLDQLLEVGLLQIHLPEIGHDPDWPVRLADELQCIEGSDVADQARAFLKRVADATNRVRALGLVTDAGRSELTTLEQDVESTLQEWFETPVRVPGPVLYEDAAINGSLDVGGDHFGPAFDTLAELLRLLEPVSWLRREPLMMRQFHERRFDDGAVPLLDFYEAYYREIVKPEEERKRRAAERARSERTEGTGAETDTERESEEQPSGEEEPGAPETPSAAGSEERDEPPPLQAIRAAHARLSVLSRQRWIDAPDAREITLGRAELAEAIGDAPSLPNAHRSLTAFVTFVSGGDSPGAGRLVFPQARAYCGFGKYFSRFLYVLPDEVLESLRGASPWGGDPVFAEIAGDAAFNANLRPPIRDCEIEYPTGDRIGCGEALQIDDLEVLPGAGDHLELVHRPTGRRVQPLDLGFLNPLVRPPLYRLLRTLGPATGTFLAIPNRPTPAPGPDGPGPIEALSEPLRRPRFTYEGRIVLARESWFVPVEQLPVQEADEVDGEFFVRVQCWRRDVGLPESTYLRLVWQQLPRRPESPESPAPSGRVRSGAKRGDLSKPQYLDFASPALVRLLERYAAMGHPWLAVFEERLPDEAELVRDDEGRAWVTEGIVQVELPVVPGGAGSESDEAGSSRSREVIHA